MSRSISDFAYGYAGQALHIKVNVSLARRSFAKAGVPLHHFCEAKIDGALQQLTTNNIPAQHRNKSIAKKTTAAPSENYSAAIPPPAQPPRHPSCSTIPQPIGESEEQK